MAGFDLKEIERRMRGALTVLKQEFGGLRTGRAALPVCLSRTLLKNRWLISLKGRLGLG